MAKGDLGEDSPDTLRSIVLFPLGINVWLRVGDELLNVQTQLGICENLKSILNSAGKS